MSTPECLDTPDWCVGWSLNELIGSFRPRFVVATARPWMEAYCSLDMGELQHRTTAVLNHSEGFAYWLGILALYRAAFSTTHDLGHFPPGEHRTAAEFRIDLLGLAGGNIKLAIDAALAGYYSGCMALERHMLETWRRAAYSRVHSADVWRWLPVAEWPEGLEPALDPKEPLGGRMPTWAPGAEKIAKAIRRHGDPEDRVILPKMEQGFKYLNHHAHPTLEGAGQTWSQSVPGDRVFGPTHSEHYAERCLDWGLFAGTILLTEVRRLAPDTGMWGDQLDLLTREIAKWSLGKSRSVPDAERQPPDE